MPDPKALADEIERLAVLCKRDLEDWDNDEPREDFWSYQRLVALIVENSGPILAALRKD